MLGSRAALVGARRLQLQPQRRGILDYLTNYPDKVRASQREVENGVYATRI